MLELKNIKKDYPAGTDTVHALKGIDLQFRESEFVSILGPSGCGKTTMLNIIGGLDGYSYGDLIINGRSTKDFKDRDWDSYRNHSIGFVFQSYNLIPHQTVLQNVELALTLTGVSKSERKTRAKKALEEVGLGDQLNKKPGEMSGGQMQRVAIARAIVNDPDIILADEPTGALDTETSKQVMDILKEISKNRLIIMVTHNPDIAEKYSTRIIRMLDGVITDDSDPLTDEEYQTEKAAAIKKSEKNKMAKKPTMSWVTSFGLSMKNLFTKKGRTALTSFAGSIGIIGIALIFSVSHGMTSYIDTVQEDTLSAYPLTLEAQQMDLGTLLETFIGKATSDTKNRKDAVYQNPIIYDLIDSLNTAESQENDLAAFKAFIEKETSNVDSESAFNDALNGVQYTYNTDLLVYTKSVDGTIIHSDVSKLMEELILEHFSLDFSSMMNIGEYMGMNSSSMMSMELWQEMLPGKDGKLVNELLEKQYDVVYGSWPTEYNEIVLVLNDNNEIADITLYALGLKSKAEIDAVAQAALDKTKLDISEQKWTYEEICDMEFRTILGSDCYTLDEKTGLYTDLRETGAGMKYLYDNGTVLKVSGIIRPNEDAVTVMLTGTIGYTSGLTEYIIEKSESSNAVIAQKSDTSIDIFTGLPFRETLGNMSNSEKENTFRAYIAKLNEIEKAQAYISIMSLPTQAEIDATVEQTLGSMTREDIEEIMLSSIGGQTGMSTEDIAGYIAAMSDEDIKDLFTQNFIEQFKLQYAEQVKAQLEPMGQIQLAGALDMAMSTYTAEQCANYHDNILEFSESNYESNLLTLGCVDLDSPATINLFASSFESKDVIEEAITDYNNSVDELQKIVYTDYVGLMMSSVTSIINAITYVLIGFVAISLIVSSIMIGVITLISVQERTKEIGILRAIGASKKNVSSMFNAETVIIGFTSGLLGVLITYILNIPINIVFHNVTGINSLNAYLPVPVAVALVGISVLLTLFAGIIPSRSAAKKDPVVALRSE